MNIQSFELDASCKLIPVNPDKAIERWHQGDGVYWFDLASMDKEAIRETLAPFDLIPFLRERCLNVGEATQIIPLPDATYLEIAVFTDPQCSKVANVGALCLKNLLITIHSDPIHTIDVFREATGDVSLRKRDIADLLVALLLFKLDDAAKNARLLRTKLDDLDDRMDHDPDSVELEEVLDAKQAVAALVSVSEEQEETFDILASTESDVLDFSGLQGPLNLLTSVSGSANRRADRLATTVADLRQRLEMNQQDRTNHRLAILTVISAVFLPLTLIAGIWGMNFDNMPELHTGWGYFGGLGLMALVAATMTWLFYRRGWFK